MVHRRASQDTGGADTGAGAVDGTGTGARAAGRATTGATTAARASTDAGTTARADTSAGTTARASTDASTATEPAPALTERVEPSPMPEHQRAHGALYGGLNHGQLEVGRFQRAPATSPLLPRAADGRIVLAAEVSRPAGPTPSPAPTAPSAKPRPAARRPSIRSCPVGRTPASPPWRPDAPPGPQLPDTIRLARALTSHRSAPANCARSSALDRRAPDRQCQFVSARSSSTRSSVPGRRAPDRQCQVVEHQIVSARSSSTRSSVPGRRAPDRSRPIPRRRPRHPYRRGRQPRRAPPGVPAGRSAATRHHLLTEHTQALATENTQARPLKHSSPGH